MKIKYRSNLCAGCVSLIFAIVLFFIIPSQIGAEYQSIHGITSRSMPYALVGLDIFCGVALIIKSLVFKNDEVKELELTKEKTGLLYIGILIIYGFGFSYSYLVSTILLGAATLAIMKNKKISYYLVIVVLVVIMYFSFTKFLNVNLP